MSSWLRGAARLAGSAHMPAWSTRPPLPAVPAATAHSRSASAGARSPAPASDAPNPAQEAGTPVSPAAGDADAGETTAPGVPERLGTATSCRWRGGAEVLDFEHRWVVPRGSV
jgi:hypothetical protein